MSAPDMLRFLGGPVANHEVGWKGPWPPPERMGLAVGAESGMVKVFDPTEIAPDVLAELENCDTIKIEVYRRRNASRLTEAQLLETTHVFRGAEYVPVGDGQS